MRQSDRGVMVILAAAAWLCLETWKVTVASVCAPPTPLRYVVARKIDRAAIGFTEGLIFRDGYLYESTGGYGSSGLNRIDPKTGTVDSLATLPKDQFGEGLETDGKAFFQLTWKEHRMNVWDSNGKFIRSESYPYEGWGLARGPHGVWISSDGSNGLYFFDPAKTPPGASAWRSDFKLPVMNETQPESRLNELEFASGVIFANIYQEPRIVRIDPASGCVTGTLDLGPIAASSGVDLAQNPDNVLNGIAYRPETGTFFITGKNWPAIYEVRIFSGGN